MKNAGISQGIAWSEEEYVQWGIKLGLDKNLREEVQLSITSISSYISPLECQTIYQRFRNCLSTNVEYLQPFSSR
jgi:predicted O-linked N-acetylglucosamine transferase (SPINDLY family)